MASSLLLAEISATCSAIGLLEGDAYYPSDDCVETLKDLIRYLRRDGEGHEIRRKLGETQVLVFDLLPLLRGHFQNNEILSNCLRLLVNLTNPVMFLFGDDLPSEKVARNHCEAIEQHLVRYKQAFANQSVWEVFVNVLNELLRKVPIQRGEEDNQMIQRILILMCNLLRVPPSTSDERRNDTDTSLHDELLWCLHTSGMNDILTYLATTERESNFFMHLLEIFHFMFAGHDPKIICNAVKERSQDEKLNDQLELNSLKETERQATAKKLKDGISSRHSRFGGTYVVKDFKAIGNEDLLVHKPVSSLESVDLNKDKSSQKVRKMRKPMQKEKGSRISAFSIRLFMREFCIGILNSGGYQILIHHARRMIDSGKTQPNDETYYLWAVWFFTRFNYHDFGKFKFVSETLNIQTFHFISTQVEKYYDAMNTDKKHIKVWSKRMHYAVRVYHALLSTLKSMDSDKNSATRSSSNVIQSNLFYGLEYRELILTLLLYYDERKFTLLYLTDLIKTTHIFLRLLEVFCGKNRSSLVIQEVRKRKVSKPKKKKQNAELVPPLEQSWESFAPELSAVLQQNDIQLPEVVPFDATLETAIDDQRALVMSNIRQHLFDGKPEMAISLLRAAREVWPENDSFGSMNMSSSDEFMALRDIFMTVLPGVTAPSLPANDTDDEEPDEEQPPEAPVVETQFNFDEFVNRFAQPQVAQALVNLLSNFEHNDPQANNAILKLMFRIVKNIGLPALFYQLSLFSIFQKMFKLNRSRDKDLIKFGKYLLNLFRHSSIKNPKVYGEVLFWTSKKDAIDVIDGSYDANDSRISAQRAWTEEEDDELHRLYEEYQSIEGGGNAMDVGEWILSNLIRQDRTKRGVNKKLREFGYDLKAKTAGSHAKPPKEWGEDELVDLQLLWEQFRESKWPLGNIVDNLKVKRTHNRVLQKILELGLAADKKELHKKRGWKQERRFDDSAGDDSNGSQGSQTRKATNQGESKDTDSEDSQPSDSRTKAKHQLTRGERKRTVTTGDSGKSSDDESVTPNRKPRRKMSQTRNNPKFIKKGVRACLARECRDTLQWVNEQLKLALEDDEDGIDIPLLPTDATISKEIQQDCFKHLFRAVGIINIEQSVYPRISGDQSHRDIADIVSQIDSILEKEKSARRPEATDSVAFKRARDSPIPASSRTGRSDEEEPLSHLVSSDEDGVDMEISPVEMGKNRRRRLVSSDEDELNVDIGNGGNGTGISPPNKQDKENETPNGGVHSSQKRKGVATVFSSSDDEHYKGKQLPNKVFRKKGSKKLLPSLDEQEGKEQTLCVSMQNSKKDKVVGLSEEEKEEEQGQEHPAKKQKLNEAELIALSPPYSLQSDEEEQEKSFSETVISTDSPATIVISSTSSQEEFAFKYDMRSKYNDPLSSLPSQEVFESNPYYVLANSDTYTDNDATFSDGNQVLSSEAHTEVEDETSMNSPLLFGISPDKPEDVMPRSLSDMKMNSIEQRSIPSDEQSSEKNISQRWSDMEIEDTEWWSSPNGEQSSEDNSSQCTLVRRVRRY